MMRVDGAGKIKNLQSLKKENQVMNIEKSIKQRFRRAVKAAQRILSYPEGSAKVIELNNHVFHLEAIRQKEIRKIRIVLDKSTKEDIELVKNYPLPENCTKEIWCRNKNGKFNIQIC